MKVCIYGLGAIGGHIAARLSQGGADVSVIARAATADVIRQNGLLVKTLDGDIHAKVTVASDPRDLGAQDFVIVTVKAPSLPDVAAGIAPLLGPQTSVVFAMNGMPWWYFHRTSGPMAERRMPLIDPDDAIWNAVGPARAIGAIVNTACVVVEPGIIQVTNRTNRLILGEPDGNTSTRVETLASAMRTGGFNVDVTPRIRDEVWDKLVGNLCGGPLAVLALSKAKDVYNDPVCDAAIRRLIDEVTAIATALGCDVRSTPQSRLQAGRNLDHKPSMVQDLERGRAMEIDSMISVPLDLARELAVPTPTLDLMAALIKLRARAAGLYHGA